MNQIEKANLITRTVCDDLGQDLRDIKGVSRRREYVTARHFSMHYIRKFTSLSLPATGRLFYRDHATVMNAENVVSNLISHNGYKSTDERLTRKLINLLYPDQRVKENRRKRIRYHYRAAFHVKRHLIKIKP